MKNPKQIFEDLCEKAINLGIMRPYRSFRKEKFDKPGGFIKQQSEEDRELLKQLTSDDVKNANVLRVDLYTDPTEQTDLNKMHKLMENAKK